MKISRTRPPRAETGSIFYILLYQLFILFTIDGDPSQCTPQCACIIRPIVSFTPSSSDESVRSKTERDVAKGKDKRRKENKKRNRNTVKLNLN